MVAKIPATGRDLDDRDPAEAFSRRSDLGRGHPGEDDHERRFQRRWTTNFFFSRESWACCWRRGRWRCRYVVQGTWKSSSSIVLMSWVTDAPGRVARRRTASAGHPNRRGRVPLFRRDLASHDPALQAIAQCPRRPSSTCSTHGITSASGALFVDHRQQAPTLSHVRRRRRAARGTDAPRGPGPAPHPRTGATLTGRICMGPSMGPAITYIGKRPQLHGEGDRRGGGVRIAGIFGYMAYSAAILIPLIRPR